MAAMHVAVLVHIVGTVRPWLPCPFVDGAMGGTTLMPMLVHYTTPSWMCRSCFESAAPQGAAIGASRFKDDLSSRVPAMA
jgi:hypothetical protein